MIDTKKIIKDVKNQERSLGQYARAEIPLDDFIKEAYIQGYADGHHDGWNQEKSKIED